MTETLGQRLRRLRDEHGYSVADLASAAGCSEGALNQLERGQVKSPSLLLGVRLAERLHVDPRYLALGEHPTLNERFDAMEARFAALEKRLARSDGRR